MSHRVVVTGAGCITPLGSEIDEVWQNLTEGRSGIGPIRRFDARGLPVRIAAEVRDWDLSEVGEDPAAWKSHPRQTHFAVGAAVKAVRSAGLALDRLDPLRFGVYLGCGETFPDLEELAESMAPAMRDGKFDAREFTARALRTMDPDSAANCEPHVPAQCLAALFGAQGPHANCIAACASSSQAIGNAAEIIHRGEADVMLAGGAHSMIHPLGITGLAQLGVLSLANERNGRAMRPFDAQRDGFVVGEGSAIVVLESLEHARARHAEIWGELEGYASAHEAFHLTDTHPDGRGLARCVRQALREARLNLDDIDYVNAHGTSTRQNDRIETQALKNAFGAGAYAIPVSSTKSMMGHFTTASGAVELLVALMVVRTGVIPPTINYETADPQCDLDYVPNAARQRKCRRALSNSLGFGGQNAALVVSRFDERSACVGWRPAA
jgi:3-oxoacyl-[acyl-carrier-protein] synthase II